MQIIVRGKEIDLQDESRNGIYGFISFWISIKL